MWFQLSGGEGGGRCRKIIIIHPADEIGVIAIFAGELNYLEILSPKNDTIY